VAAEAAWPISAMNSSSETSSVSVNGESIIQSCGFHPLVAVLSSSGADDICKKNNFSNFADLLAPFSSVTFVIKDPAGIQLSSKVKIDFRDIAKSGCLWSLTVLPSILDQVVSSIAATNSSEDVWSSAFRDAFCYWLEPTEHDFFKSYLCCIFVVSAEEEDLMGELARLVQKQNTQQHGGAESATVLGPAHCSSPKWFLPNILKHYVVLHDVASGNEEKAIEVFNKVSGMYGNDCCQLLKINSSKEETNLPDPWHQILEQRYRGLESGLELARKRLIEKNANNGDSTTNQNSSVSSLPIAATISSSIPTPVFSTNSAAAVPSVSSLPVQLSANNGVFFENSFLSNSSRPFGQYLLTSDREEVKNFVEKFVKHSLIPFVEKQIFAQNDILQNRRGIGKSFTNVRKWLSSASTPASGQQVNYGPESAEIQTRRLADLAFLFGLYAFSHSLYQSVKKDFASNNARLYQAGALEMAALSFYLSSNQVSPKQIPIRYLDTALDFYMNDCIFSQANQRQLSLKCYNNAATEYLDKGWQFAEDHILFTLSHGSDDPRFQVDCVTKLVKPSDNRILDLQTQTAFIEYYIKTLSKKSLKIIYGEKPETTENFNEKKKKMEEEIITWEDLERAAFYSISGKTKPFLRECPMFSDNETKNHNKKETPPFERFRVQFKLLNPMYAPLVLRNIKLVVNEVSMRDNATEADAFSDIGTIPELVLAATELPSFNPVNNEKIVPPVSETLVELHVVPTDKVSSFSVKEVSFDISTSDGVFVPGKIPIELKRKRLFKTKEQRMKKMYATDLRLTTSVSLHQWPLLNFELSGQAARSRSINAYCNQVFQVMVTLDNIGEININGISIATDEPEYVAISEQGKNQSWNLCPAQITPNGILYHTVSNIYGKLEPKSKITLRMAIKAPEEVVEEKIYQILFFYMGENGYFREYRYSIQLSTQALLKCTPRILSEESQVCGIEVKNLIPSRDAILAKVEILRLKVISKEADENNPFSDIDLSLIVKRQIAIEGEQSDIIPFFVKIVKNGASTIWLTETICDIPSFNNVMKYQMAVEDEIRQQGNRKIESLDLNNLENINMKFSLLWKAHVASSAGNVATIFGEIHNMASQTAGIQQLLAAEKRAAEKINEARKKKAQRLRQAKQEAQAEIEKYRQERERGFKEYEQQYLGTKEDIESQIRRETDNTLAEMQRSVGANKQQVIIRLLQLVCDIRPELHHNLILQKDLEKKQPR
ncbi:hypothetical protein FO519_008509, partial [Halicephalobus sp. NKZ332]